MKIRINGDSLRLRLSQKEVSDLETTGKVSSECRFPHSTFQYALYTGANSQLEARCEGTAISVVVPQHLVAGWSADQRIGFDGRDSNGLYILVEKDFQCLKPRPEEDEAGLYPNPQAGEDHNQC